MHNAYNTYNDIWDTQNLYQENLYIFEPIHIFTMTTFIQCLQQPIKTSIVKIHNKIRRRRPTVVACHLYPLVRMVIRC